ncbi:MAG: thiol-activated cytolysin family protein, partial [Rubrivivax sp.]|nr:thiol-activated cytolysin family protein [Rubrivivax sp.]
MRTRMPSWGRWMGTIAAAALAGACGGGGGDAVVTTQPQSYLQELPTWAQYSPPAQSVTPTTTGKTSDSTETIENVPVIDPVTQAVVGYRTEAYNCTTAEFTMTDTPEKIVMFSPDREVLWPGGLLQGKSHRDGVGSLLPLTIHERAAIKVSIPSLATADNFRVVDVPDQAEVNRAIGAMISNAHTSNLVTPSTIQFSMEDFNSEQAFALQAKVSGRYLGFSGSASASVARNANEHTVMVHFYEKMFEVVVEPPPTPAGFFSAEFTGPRLAEQIALGKIGPDNPPVYVSNVVYGRMMAFTFTSTATRTEIKSALNAAYKGIFSASASLSHQQRKVLEEARIAITSLGGQSKATTAMIASGDWKQYFSENAPLTSAYPISYTFRNLRDGSIAKVSESTRYDIKECQLKGSAFTGFVLD